MTAPDAYLSHLHNERWEITRVTTGKGIEISDHQFVVLPKAIKVLTADDPVIFKDYVRFIVKDFSRCDEVASASLDFVLVTERDRVYITPEAAQCWMAKLKVGGYLILHHRVGNDYKFVVQKRTEAGLRPWIYPTLPEKNVAVIRYGAYGDMMQASSVVAGLKAAGYHVTLYCSPPGHQVVTHDPNIDEIVLQDKDQVRNNELELYWNWLRAKHAKVVNLCESVERTWLARKGDSKFDWPYEVRSKYLNKNYLQFQHELAGIPHRPRVKFYPTREEVNWAEAERKRMTAKKVVMWSLTGSSVHKVMPWMDEFVAGMMTMTVDVDVVLVGGPEAVPLEDGWQEEARVHLRSGVWSIRQTMVFAQTQTDLLIGPETGVLNAMCQEELPKIIFLSHSTEQNLTRDWVSTTSITAPETELAKCKHCCLHRLHMSWDDVKRDEQTGAAHCQSKIDRTVLFDTAMRKLGKGRKSHK